MDLNLFVSVLLRKEAARTAAGNQTNANAASGMEMTAKHQKSLSVTATTAGICTCVYNNTDNIFSHLGGGGEDQELSSEGEACRVDASTFLSC